MKYLLAYHTDKGPLRTVNQDSLLVLEAAFGGESVLLAAVCDGMGGLKKGEAASASVIEGLSFWFRTELPELLGSSWSKKKLFLSWDRLLRREHRRLEKHGRQSGNPLGTTVTAMLFFKEFYYIAHVGDSRAYEAGKSLRQLTEDQTFVFREVSEGRMTPEQARRDPRRNVLLQCVGASEKMEPVFLGGRVKRGALYLLCSDGFFRWLGEEDILGAFADGRGAQEEALKSCCERLGELVRGRGERDDSSVIAIRCS